MIGAWARRLASPITIGHSSVISPTHSPAWQMWGRKLASRHSALLLQPVSAFPPAPASPDAPAEELPPLPAEPDLATQRPALQSGSSAPNFSQSASTAH